MIETERKPTADQLFAQAAQKRIWARRTKNERLKARLFGEADDLDTRASRMLAKAREE